MDVAPDSAVATNHETNEQKQHRAAARGASSDFQSATIGESFVVLPVESPF
jgi:hypothetical protein